jgi:hypothetical protein
VKDLDDEFVTEDHTLGVVAELVDEGGGREDEMIWVMRLLLLTSHHWSLD